jgi:hypothetical protein
LACRDWLAVPRSVEFLREPRGYVPNEIPLTDEEIRLQELLSNRAARFEEIARHGVQAPVHGAWAGHPEFHNCPFHTENECRIWRRLPPVRETATSRVADMPQARMAEMIALLQAGNYITADMRQAQPLVDIYRTLLAASSACCTSGMIHQLQTSGISRAGIYQIMTDDKHFAQFGERCLVMQNKEFAAQSQATQITAMASQVRDMCLCRQRDYFESLLAPFTRVARASPKFRDSPFNWTYTDGLGRPITVSINQDVNNVLERLARCI